MAVERQIEMERLASFAHGGGAFVSIALSQALGHARIAVLVTDRHGRLKFANHLGQALLGGDLKIIGDRLAAIDDRATPALRRAIEAAATRPAGDAQEVLVDTLGDACEALRLVVVSLDWPGDEGLAMLMAVDGAPRFDCARLRTAFGLTPAEAKLLRALIDGDRISDHAARYGIKQTTAKSHLRQLFLKFGESRQADLVRRALNDPALRLALEPIAA
ncbi:hypothetical protein [Brevundimonas sp. Root1423]|uniref:helix-turn-helix transcriptional regulator n=1 Tax=Brevundimonas sp. Root1423 TaxID=1736462 RepID=UPI00070185A2|nr:hypothetical protein [Brevundimonas sp. Root1423]KQY89778.1 hypothetical protein ASD25_04405 [Brevundimonas sp. Root1423]